MESPQERAIVSRFADAFESGDIEGAVRRCRQRVHRPVHVALLTDDALLTTPPQPLEYEGRQAIAEFFSVVPAAHGFDRFRFSPTRANGQPALLYANQDDGGPNGIVVLALEGERIAGITRFRLEPETAWPGARS